MHESALVWMGKLLDRYDAPSAKCLDVGSRDVNGTYRALIEGRGWSYTGLDILPGPNVDVVTRDAYHYPFEDGAFDVVINGSTMEHVEALWLWMDELARVLAPGGFLAICTVWQCPEHRYPVDCWRILPDGIRFLFQRTGVLTNYFIVKDATGDLAASAFKRT